MRSFNHRVSETKRIVSNIIVVVIILLLLVGGLYSQVKMAHIDEYKYQSEDIPIQYNGLRIAHVSNIANNPKNTCSLVTKAKPDIVVITGGIADGKGNIKKSADAINKIASKFPTYYVLSDSDLDYKDDIVSSLKAKCLDNNAIQLTDRIITVEQYVNSNFDKKSAKSALKSKDGKKYREYIQNRIDTDKDKKFYIIGMNGELDNIYDSLDCVYELKKGSDYSVLLYGDSTELSILSKSSVNLAFTNINNSEQTLNTGLNGINGMQTFVDAGVNKGAMNGFRGDIQVIELHSGNIVSKNPLENLLERLIGDPGTIFDNDEGFSSYRYEF